MTPIESTVKQAIACLCEAGYPQTAANLEQAWPEINSLERRLAAAEAAATRANLLLQAATEAAFGRALTEEQVPHSGISDQAIRSAYELLDYHNEETEKSLTECRRLLREFTKPARRWSQTEWLVVIADKDFEAAKAGGVS